MAVSKKLRPPAVYTLLLSHSAHTQSVVVSEWEIGSAKASSHSKAVPTKLVAAAVARQATWGSRSCKKRWQELHRCVLSHIISKLPFIVCQHSIAAYGRWQWTSRSLPGWRQRGDRPRHTPGRSCSVSRPHWGRHTRFHCRPLCRAVGWLCRGSQWRRYHFAIGGSCRSETQQMSRLSAPITTAAVEDALYYKSVKFCYRRQSALNIDSIGSGENN